MVDIAFPGKGWHTNCLRNDQPDGTSPDLLNVLPFDRDYRIRGAVRPGTSKYVASQLGSGYPVLLLENVTVALDPSTIVPNQVIVNETFSYADGDLFTRPATPWAGGNVFLTFYGSDPGTLLVSSSALTVLLLDPGNSPLYSCGSPWGCLYNKNGHEDRRPVQKLECGSRLSVQCHFPHGRSGASDNEKRNY